MATQNGNAPGRPVFVAAAFAVCFTGADPVAVTITVVSVAFVAFAGLEVAVARLLATLRQIKEPCGDSPLGAVTFAEEADALADATADEALEIADEASALLMGAAAEEEEE